MNDKATSARRQRKLPAITAVTVQGYKSIAAETTIEVRPLTILAGANSSGKSSIMQPLLLLKQTLTEAADPGAILLEGPNVTCTSAKDILCRCKSCEHKDRFMVGIHVETHGTLSTAYAKKNGGFIIKEMRYRETSKKIERAFSEDLDHDAISSLMLPEHKDIPEAILPGSKWKVIRSRCFLEVALAKGAETVRLGLSPAAPVIFQVQRIIHLPGLRGNPERMYLVRATGRNFPGRFQDYVASVILKWQTDKSDKVRALWQDLKELNLTWKVQAKRIGDTRIKIEVGRLPSAAVGGSGDLVNIADVGFGVSQSLPVLVALRAAEEGQLVYIEQPEIHLHPRAQLKMADLLVDAANRGVRVVAETHSALLLLGVQSAVAQGRLSPDNVKLHWFRRDERGFTKVTSTDVDRSGAFGEDWPEDFGLTELEAQHEYLTAAERRLSGQ